MKKGCFCLAGLLFLAIVIAQTTFWYQNGPGNRYDVARLKREIARDLPIGSSKTKIKSWLVSNGFDVYEQNANSPTAILGGRRYDTRSEIVCTYDALVTFALDGKNRLLRSDVEELSACW